MKQMPARDKITLVLLVLMSVFLFADQRIMSAILPEISAEYGFDARMLGFIGSAPGASSKNLVQHSSVPHVRISLNHYIRLNHFSCSHLPGWGACRSPKQLLQFGDSSFEFCRIE